MHTSTSHKNRQVRVQALHQEVVELEKKLGHHEDADHLVATHIKLLHRYNEAKDAAQILIGRLASHRGTTIRELHNEFGLSDQD